LVHTINIEGINIYAYHGCLDEEARTGGNYVIDVYISTDFTEAIKKDELSTTIDYCAVYEICKKEMAIRNKLIEPVCGRIYHALKNAFPQILSLHVKLTKIAPPINGHVEKVSVEMKD
jgi:7,8-dihydroneopterin aldolase/epimerase/oxygenase